MYGTDGEPAGFTVTGDNDFEMGFFYTKNLQGDITGIYTTEGASCLTFTYDAYGTPTYTLGDSFVGAWLSLVFNSFLYRGYMYDTETGLYYLQSRFYNPIYGRFINADETMMLHFTQGDVHGANLFAYCGNNLVMNIDENGYYYISLKSISKILIYIIGFNPIASVIISIGLYKLKRYLTAKYILLLAKLGSFWGPIVSVSLALIGAVVGIPVISEVAKAFFDCVLQRKKGIEFRFKRTRRGIPYGFDIYAR